MTTTNQHPDTLADERRLERLMECAAMGLTVAETVEAMGESITGGDLREARREALAQGIEREDMDPSWFGDSTWLAARVST